MLIIPKKHIASLDDVTEEDKELLGHIMIKVREIAETLGLENGYRLVNNCGEDGFQTVKPVSYTHLDVYKRQGVDIVTGTNEKGRLPEYVSRYMDDGVKQLHIK